MTVLPDTYKPGLHNNRVCIRSRRNSETRENGIKISIGHQAENIINADLLVYTAAVKHDNPELLAASTADIPIADRAAAVTHEKVYL